MAGFDKIRTFFDQVGDCKVSKETMWSWYLGIHFKFIPESTRWWNKGMETIT